MKSLKEWQDKAKAKAKPAKKEFDEEAAVDVFAVEDICDVGGGVPLLAGISFEDWSLLTLRKDRGPRPISLLPISYYIMLYYVTVC